MPRLSRGILHDRWSLYFRRRRMFLQPRRNRVGRFVEFFLIKSRKGQLADRPWQSKQFFSNVVGCKDDGGSQECTCKANVEGSSCSVCKPGHYGLSADNPKGCQKCYCSGVSDQCTSSDMYWSTLRWEEAKHQFLDSGNSIVFLIEPAFYGCSLYAG